MFGITAELRILNLLRRRSKFHQFDFVEEHFFSERTRPLFIHISGYHGKYDEDEIGFEDLKVLIQNSGLDRTKTKDLLRMIRKMRRLEEQDPLVEDLLVRYTRNYLVRALLVDNLKGIDNSDYDPAVMLSELERILELGQSKEDQAASDLLTKISLAKVETVALGVHGAIDEALRGGMAVGELGCILAPPGIGKTTTLIRIGTSALEQGWSVIHFTLELSGTTTKLRYCSAITRLPEEEMVTPRGLEVLEKKRRIFRKREQQLEVVDLSSYSPKPYDLERLINQMMKGDKFVVLVDYPALMSSTSKYREKRFELAEIYRDLRKLASKKGVPMVGAHQANKKVLERKDCSMADFAECTEIAAIIDWALGLTQHEEAQEEGVIQVRLLKNRRLDKKTRLVLDFDPGTCSFS